MKHYMMVSNQILLNPSFIARRLGIVGCLLVLASIGTTAYMTWRGHLYHPVALFYLDEEKNIPTFFSSCLLLFAALLLFIITLLEKSRSAARIVYWKILSIAFLLMAIDEFASLHETMMLPIRNFLGNGKLGIFYFSWVIPAILIIILFTFLFWKFLFCLHPKTRHTFLLAATIYLGGCIGFEMIGGYYTEAHGHLNWIYGTIATIEESLEMMGVIIFIWGLLTYLANNHQEVLFHVDDAREKIR
jgi:hypothetical protein